MTLETPLSHPLPGPAGVALNAGLANARWSAADLVFWLAPVLAFFAFPNYLALGGQILTAALAALALDLALGVAGIVSLGHAAFFGVGAYTAGLLAVHGWREPLTGLAAGGLAAGLFGGAASLLVVRGKDLTRLMVTLGLVLMLYEAANTLSFITGGADGLSGIEIDRIFGVFGFDLAGRTAYWYGLVVLFCCFAFVKRLTASPFGLSLRAIKSGVGRMPALGVAVDRRLEITFAISAALAGLAGALMAQTTQFVGVDAVSAPRSLEFLIMLALGGVGRLYGGLVGAAIFMIAHDLLSDLNPVYWQFWMGLLLMAIVLFGKGGALGAGERLVMTIAKGRTS
jgi:branched-chain amino acid transport system permease protein